MSVPTPEQVATGAQHLFIAKAYSIGIFSMAVYEYVITFGDEVRQVWQKKKSFATVLWTMNRYLMLLGFVPIEYFIFARSDLEQYVKFPAAMQLVANFFIGVTLILRTYALYARNRWILVILVPLLGAEMLLQAYVSSIGTAVPLPPIFTGCIETGRADTGNQYSMYWIGELVFPTVVFLLTLFRALFFHRMGQHIGTGKIFTVILRDGVAYFFVIFIVNLVNVVTYSTAVPDLQAVNATLSALMTEIMICRLMLNLRDVASRPTHHSFLVPETIGNFSDRRIGKSWTKSLIGNLGEELYESGSGNGSEASETLVGETTRRYHGHGQGSYSADSGYELGSVGPRKVR